MKKQNKKKNGGKSIENLIKSHPTSIIVHCDNAETSDKRSGFSILYGKQIHNVDNDDDFN